MSVFTYPDGSKFTSTALTFAQIQTAFQIVTCQMLGILTSPWTVDLMLTSGLQTANATSVNNLYAGQLVACPGLPLSTLISGVGPGDIVIFNNAATLSGLQHGSVTDPNAYGKVRIGWQQQGQPGPGINEDTCFLRCAPMDSDYSRVRDITNTDGSTTITQTDVFTRAWRTYWTFYGPNGLDRARAVRSALIKVDFVANLLAESNLYVNPSIAEPQRVPEEFQGEWWERVDLIGMFNEQITETLVVNAVASVEVVGLTDAGQFTDFTVEI